VERFLHDAAAVELTVDDALPPSKREILLGLVRLAAGLVALFAIVGFLGWAYRDELERFGAWFVARFGIVGMAAGAFLADGLHFPLPPQFYLLTGIAGGVGTAAALLSVLVGSVLGGFTIFTAAARVSRVAFFARRFATTRHMIVRLMRRYGVWGLVVAGMLPVSYFVLCVLGGMMHLRNRDYGVLALMRIPRLVLSYLLIVLAWGG
jgi:membrane protein YqaA with SNARE-associated domain